MYLADLEKKLGYRFKQLSHLKLALTHRSFSGKENNERLEFLGDSIINLVIANTVFSRFPNGKEGQLSRLRAYLVSGESLAKLARSFNLGAYIQLGPGEVKSGGHQRDSILADTMEAVVGAIHLDSDMETCAACIQSWFADQFEQLTVETLKDPKTQLQEYLQSKQLPLPRYEVVNIVGKDHNQYFEVACIVDIFDEPGEGKAKSRKKAEQLAAQHIIDMFLGTETTHKQPASCH